MRVVQDTIADKIEAAGPLLRAHWLEVARNKNVMVLKPDVQRYAELEAAGLLIGLIAYDGDQMVGYCISILSSSHLHYADLVSVNNDLLFVLPEYRGASRVGLRLIAETERIAAERGARMVTWHAKEGSTLDLLMRRRHGYGVQDVLHSKVLE